MDCSQVTTVEVQLPSLRCLSFLPLFVLVISCVNTEQQDGSFFFFFQMWILSVASNPLTCLFSRCHRTGWKVFFVLFFQIWFQISIYPSEKPISGTIVVIRGQFIVFQGKELHHVPWRRPAASIKFPVSYKCSAVSFDLKIHVRANHISVLKKNNPKNVNKTISWKLFFFQADHWVLLAVWDSTLMYIQYVRS